MHRTEVLLIRYKIFVQLYNLVMYIIIHSYLIHILLIVYTIILENLVMIGIITKISMCYKPRIIMHIPGTHN